MLRPFTIFLFSFGSLCTQVSHLYAHVSGDAFEKHSTDVVLDNWNPSVFDIHETTGIRMTADNNASKLYITKQDIQKRIMPGGMQIYMYIKAKKREGVFIEFPVQKIPQEIATHLSAKTTGDIQAFREQATGSMSFLKKTVSKNQQYDTALLAINLPNEINISFGWDERSVIFSEYELPFTRLGGKEALVSIPLSVGIKLKSTGITVPLPQPARIETSIISVAANSNQDSRISQDGGSVVSSNSLRSGMPPTKQGISEQTFWLKHEVY